MIMDSLKNIPTDEQIAAWLSGTCDETERQAVERYLEENPEAVDDMLNIAMAATVQAKHDAGRAKVKKVVFRPAVWAAAASAAVVLVVGGVLLTRQPQQGDVLVANTEPANTEYTEPQAEPAEPEKTGNECVAPAHPADVAPGIQVQRTERVTASEAIFGEPTITITLPRRKREVVPVGTDILFRWTSDAPALTLTLTDGEGNLLLRTDLPANGEYKVPAAKLDGVADVQWMLTAPGAAMHSGKIEIIDD